MRQAVEQILSLDEFGAVAFDFDGTLADTVSVHGHARGHAYELMATETNDFRFSNIPRNIHERAHAHGSHPAEINAWILREAGLIDDLDPEDELVVRVVELKQKAYLELAARGIPPFIQSVQTARRIHDVMPGQLGIVTTAHSEEVEPFLGKHNLHEVFPPSNLVLHNDVVKQKPDPEAYLLFASRMDVPPNEVLVVEDSPRGIHAAKQAGCLVVGITLTHKASELTDSEFMAPDLVVRNYRELNLAVGLPDPFPETNGIDATFFQQ